MAETNAGSSVQYRLVDGFPAYRVGYDGSVWSRWGMGGRVRKITDVWRPKVADVGDKGYLRVELYDGQGEIEKRLVHRLILEAFVGTCPEGLVACHGDGNPANNSISNLRWDTPESNWEDRKRHGRDMEGIKQSQAKLDDYAVRVIRRARRRGITLRLLAMRFGVSIAKIHHVVSGKNWRHVNG